MNSTNSTVPPELVTQMPLFTVRVLTQYDVSVFSISDAITNTTANDIPMFITDFTENSIVNDVKRVFEPTESNEGRGGGGGGGGGRGYDVIGDVVKTLVLVLVMSTAVFGNALVIVSVLRTSKLRTVANAFLVSLAFADLLVALLVMTFSASQEIRGDWLWGEVACDVFNANDVMLSTASLLHLCCISIDRYIAIMDPFHYTSRVTGTTVSHMLAVTWAVSALVSHIPIHMDWYAVTSVNGTVDVLVPVEPDSDVIGDASGDVRVRCVFTANKTYCLLSSAISFWMPALLMLIIYAQLYREAERQKQNMRRLALGITASVICRRVKVAQQALDDAAAMTKIMQQEQSCVDDVTTPSSEQTITQSQSLDGTLTTCVSPDATNSDNSTAPSVVCTAPLDDGSTDSHTVGIAYNNFVNVRNTTTTTVTFSTAEDSSYGQQKHVTFSTGNDNCSDTMKRSTSTTSCSSQKCSDDEPRLRRSQSMTSSSRRKSTSLRSVRSEHKAAQTLGIIMGGFLCCWLPFFSWYAAVTLCDTCSTPPTLVSALFWIGYANSAVNPAVYALHNRDFRLAFLRQLGCNRLLLKKRQKLVAATLYD